MCLQFVGVFNGNFITTYCMILQHFKTKNTENQAAFDKVTGKSTVTLFWLTVANVLVFLHLAVDLNCQMSNKTNHNHH